MSALLERLSTHPEGESKMGSCGGDGVWPLDTPGERFSAEWDTKNRAGASRIRLFGCFISELNSASCGSKTGWISARLIPKGP